MDASSKIVKRLLWLYYCALLGILINIPQYDEAYASPFPFAYWQLFGLSISPYDIVIVLGGVASFITSRGNAVEKVMLKWGVLLLFVLVIANAVTNFRTGEFQPRGLAEIKCAVELWAITRIVTWIVHNNYLNLYFCTQILFTIGSNAFQYFSVALGRSASFGVSSVSLLSLSTMPFCVLMVAQRNSLLLRSCCAAAIASTGFVALQSTSRVNIALFILSIIGPVMYTLARGLLRKLGTFSNLVLAWGMSGMALSAIFLAFSETDIGRSYRFWEPNQGIHHDSTNAAHYNDILGGISLVLDHPIWGAGIAAPLDEYLGERTYVVIHNELLHVWAYYGICGLISFISLFYVWPLYNLYKTDREKQQTIFFFLFFAAGYFIVRATVSPPFFFSATGTYIVGTCLGFSFCRCKYCRAGRAADHGNRGEKLALQCRPGMPHRGLASKEMASRHRG